MKIRTIETIVAGLLPLALGMKARLAVDSIFRSLIVVALIIIGGMTDVEAFGPGEFEWCVLGYGDPNAGSSKCGGSAASAGAQGCAVFELGYSGTTGGNQYSTYEVCSDGLGHHVLYEYGRCVGGYPWFQLGAYSANEIAQLCPTASPPDPDPCTNVVELDSIGRMAHIQMGATDIRFQYNPTDPVFAPAATFTIQTNGLPANPAPVAVTPDQTDQQMIDNVTVAMNAAPAAPVCTSNPYGWMSVLEQTIRDGLRGQNVQACKDACDALMLMADAACALSRNPPVVVACIAAFFVADQYCRKGCDNAPH